MYSIKKTMEIAGSHSLDLPYASKCQNVHGHNWLVTVYCGAEELDDSGMVIDFTHIKQRIHDKLDHKSLNAIFDFNPTAENIAKWICDQLENCYKVEVEESRGNVAVYSDYSIFSGLSLSDIKGLI